MTVARADKGAINDASDELVKVTLQFLPQVPGGTKVARRSYLMTVFQDAVSQLRRFSIKLDVNSLTVSGQNLEATVPTRHYDDAATALARANIRMDAAIERRATLS